MPDVFRFVKFIFSDQILHGSKYLDTSIYLGPDHVCKSIGNQASDWLTHTRSTNQRPGFRFQLTYASNCLSHDLALVVHHPVMVGY